MEPENNSFFTPDVERCHQRLERILSQWAEEDLPLPRIEEGLAAAHQLKSMAALKGLAHIEAYASQLAQIFHRAMQLTADEIRKYVLPDLLLVEADYAETCKCLDEIRHSQPSLSARNSRKLASLIETLKGHEKPPEKAVFSFSKRPKRQPKTVTLDAVFKSFVPWVQQAASSTGKAVNIELEAPDAISLNSRQTTAIQGILLHLLRNAIHHGIESREVRKARSKDEKGHIRLHASIEGDTLHLAVSDDGAGMNQQDASHPLEHPKTVSSFPESGSSVSTSIYATENAITGLGIGLHVVRSHLKPLNGELSLKSVPGAGTSAIVRIPLNTPQPQAIDAP